MNREALFCDGTGDYVIPAEPEINEKVVLRFRTAHNDVDEVKLHAGRGRSPYGCSGLFRQKMKFHTP